jgi:hypothetical protein
MSKIIKIDRFEVKKIRAALEKHLATFGTDLGIRASVGNGGFDSRSVYWKVEFSIIDGKSADSKDKSDFEYYAASFGLAKEDWGKPFINRGKTFRICGVAPRSWKFPILGKSPRGKVYKFPAKSVLAGLGKQTVSHSTLTEDERTEADFDEDMSSSFFVKEE